MLIVVIFAGTLEARKYADRTLERERDIQALYNLTNMHSGADSIEKIKETAIGNINSLLNRRVQQSLADMEVFPLTGHVETAVLLVRKP